MLPSPERGASDVAAPLLLLPAVGLHAVPPVDPALQAPEHAQGVQGRVGRAQEDGVVRVEGRLVVPQVLRAGEDEARVLQAALPGGQVPGQAVAPPVELLGEELRIQEARDEGRARGRERRGCEECGRDGRAGDLVHVVVEGPVGDRPRRLVVPLEGGAHVPHDRGVHIPVVVRPEMNEGRDHVPESERGREGDGRVGPGGEEGAAQEEKHEGRGGRRPGHVGWERLQRVSGDRELGRRPACGRGRDLALHGCGGADRRAGQGRARLRVHGAMQGPMS
mmetsp:Transcript_1448/g.4555  ORF Transcript_1448/g.4555 Transcript_1448/m.4555 type:complete len:278 (-) Transcript_1448:93-926(-)